MHQTKLLFLLLIGSAAGISSKTAPTTATKTPSVDGKADKAEGKNGDLGHPDKSVMAGLAAVVGTATCAAAAVMSEPVQQLEEEVESIGKSNF